MNFCELTRTRPDAATADGVAYPVTAQVHAFDDRSVLETPAAQGDQVRLARARSLAGAPVAVSPITLRPRFNAVAKEVAEADDALPESTSTCASERRSARPTRSRSIARSCAAAGAGLLTLFRLARLGGARRAPGRSAPPRPLRVRAPRGVPRGRGVFRALAGLHGAPLRACAIAAPLDTAAIALVRADGGTRVVVANLAEDERELRASIDGAERAARVGPRAVAILDQ